MAAQNSQEAKHQKKAPQFYMDGVEYFQVRFKPPFRVRVSAAEHWLLYRVCGEAVDFSARDADATSVTLSKGAVIAMAGVLSHQFSSPGHGQIAKPWREEALDGHAGPGEIMLAVGRISKARMALLPMYERLLIIHPGEHPALAARFSRAFEWIADELSRPGNISKEIVRRLAEITTLEITRADQQIKSASSHNIPEGVTDPRIVRAISAFYSAPQEKWSVQKLAEIAGMSRTAFALRYRALIGATPLKTIRQFRMQLANSQLSRPSAMPNIEVLAKTAGYGSDAAFIRAFSKEFGVTPGQVKLRKQTP